MECDIKLTKLANCAGCGANCLLKEVGCDA